MISVRNDPTSIDLKLSISIYNTSKKRFHVAAIVLATCITRYLLTQKTLYELLYSSKYYLKADIPYYPLKNPLIIVSRKLQENTTGKTLKIQCFDEGMQYELISSIPHLPFISFKDSVNNSRKLFNNIFNEL